MMTRRALAGLGLLAAGGAAGGATAWGMLSAPPRLTADEVLARLGKAPARPLAGPVFHLGHSLVGRDMPAMLAQLTGQDHHSQLGWGATLGQHWTGEVPGFAQENAHPAYRPASAIDAGTYDAVVLTEMVDLRDAIRYHDAPAYLARWAARAAAANPGGQVFLYETWHRTTDPAGWEARIAADRTALWQGTLLAQAMADPAVPPIRVIPGGPVLAAVAAAAGQGELPGLPGRDALFSDDIHLSDAGNHVIALTHDAVLTGRPPSGLPPALLRADGTPMAALDPAAAAAIRTIVWDRVRADPLTGLSG